MKQQEGKALGVTKRKIKQIVNDKTPGITKGKIKQHEGKILGIAKSNKLGKGNENLSCNNRDR